MDEANISRLKGDLDHIIGFCMPLWLCQKLKDGENVNDVAAAFERVMAPCFAAILQSVPPADRSVSTTFLVMRMRESIERVAAMIGDMR